MALELVKRCPGCGTERPPQTLRCDCGVLLLGIDLSEPARLETSFDPAPPAPSAEPSATVEPAVSNAFVDASLCPHSDCGQRNTPGATRCLYCNRSLESRSLFIRWPWGECDMVAGELLIGRVPPASPALIDRLEQHYTNVSRRHALLRLAADQLSIEDLGSANGTFVNEVRLSAHQPVRLHRGATVRFGADLTGAIDADS